MGCVQRSTRDRKSLVLRIIWLDLPGQSQTVVKCSERSQLFLAYQGAPNAPTDFVRRQTQDFAKQSSLQNTFVIAVDTTALCHSGHSPVILDAVQARAKSLLTTIGKFSV